MPITLSIALYSAAWFFLARSIRKRHQKPPARLQWLVALGLCAHAAGIYSQVVFAHGYLFSLAQISSVFFWTGICLLLVSSLRKPLHNLYIVMLPIAVLALLGSLYTPEHSKAQVSNLELGTVIHILLSILAYSTMIVATIQAVVLAYQNYKIRHKHPGGLVRLLPPLETMETLLFELLWVGQILLTLVIATGAFQIENIKDQQLHHKIFFTVVAWVIYAVLLWGRHALGWRGNAAIRWTLSGFAFLFLAYLGTKIVLEMILAPS